ncbi:MAG: hypothetical protein ABW189_03710 [Rickettsiales bacterium]
MAQYGAQQGGYGYVSQQSQRAAQGYGYAAFNVSPGWMQAPASHGFPPMQYGYSQQYSATSTSVNGHVQHQPFGSSYYDAGRQQPQTPTQLTPPQSNELSKNEREMHYADAKVSQFGVAKRSKARNAEGNRVDYRELESYKHSKEYRLSQAKEAIDKAGTKEEAQEAYAHYVERARDSVFNAHNRAKGQKKIGMLRKLRGEDANKQQDDLEKSRLNVAKELNDKHPDLSAEQKFDNLNKAYDSIVASPEHTERYVKALKNLAQPTAESVRAVADHTKTLAHDLDAKSGGERLISGERSGARKYLENVVKNEKLGYGVKKMALDQLSQMHDGTTLSKAAARRATERGYKALLNSPNTSLYHKGHLAGNAPHLDQKEKDKQIRKLSENIRDDHTLSNDKKYSQLSELRQGVVDSQGISSGIETGLYKILERIGKIIGKTSDRHLPHSMAGYYQPQPSITSQQFQSYAPPPQGYYAPTQHVTVAPQPVQPQQPIISQHFASPPQERYYAPPQHVTVAQPIQPQQLTYQQPQGYSPSTQQVAVAQPVQSQQSIMPQRLQSYAPASTPVTVVTLTQPQEPTYQESQSYSPPPVGENQSSPYTRDSRNAVQQQQQQQQFSDANRLDGKNVRFQLLPPPQSPTTSDSSRDDASSLFSGNESSHSSATSVQEANTPHVRPPSPLSAHPYRDSLSATAPRHDSAVTLPQSESSDVAQHRHGELKPLPPKANMFTRGVLAFKNIFSSGRRPEEKSNPQGILSNASNSSLSSFSEASVDSQEISRKEPLDISKKSEPSPYEFEVAQKNTQPELVPPDTQEQGEGRGDSARTAAPEDVYYAASQLERPISPLSEAETTQVPAPTSGAGRSVPPVPKTDIADIRERMQSTDNRVWDLLNKPSVPPVHEAEMESAAPASQPKRPISPFSVAGTEAAEAQNADAFHETLYANEYHRLENNQQAPQAAAPSQEEKRPDSPEVKNNPQETLSNESNSPLSQSSTSQPERPISPLPRVETTQVPTPTPRAERPVPSLPKTDIQERIQNARQNTENFLNTIPRKPVPSLSQAETERNPRAVLDAGRTLAKTISPRISVESLRSGARTPSSERRLSFSEKASQQSKGQESGICG